MASAITNPKHHSRIEQWIERRQRWQALLEGGLAQELAQRREELRPEMETRLKHLEGCLGKLLDGQRSIIESYYYRRDSIDKVADAQWNQRDEAPRLGAPLERGWLRLKSAARSMNSASSAARWARRTSASCIPQANRNPVPCLSGNPIERRRSNQQRTTP
jgi:hypothetical protein